MATRYSNIKNNIENGDYTKAKEELFDQYAKEKLTSDQLRELINLADNKIHFEKENYVETIGDHVGKGIIGGLAFLFTGGRYGYSNLPKTKRAPKDLEDVSFVLRLKLAEIEHDYSEFVRLYYSTNQKLFLEMFRLNTILTIDYPQDISQDFIDLMIICQINNVKHKGVSPLVWFIQNNHWLIVESIFNANIDDRTKILKNIKIKKASILKSMQLPENTHRLYLLKDLFDTPKAYYYLKKHTEFCNFLRGSDLGKGLLATSLNFHKHYNWELQVLVHEGDIANLRLAFRDGASLIASRVNWINDQAWEYAYNEENCLLDNLDNDPQLQNTIVEEAIRYWCLNNDKDVVYRTILKPIVDFYHNTNRVDELKDRIIALRDDAENPVTVDDLKIFVASFNNELAKPILEKSQDYKTKAIWLTVFSFFIIPLFLAIKYWKAYNQTRNTAPLHIYELPQNLYLRLRDEENISEDDASEDVQAKIISKNNRIKRTILEMDENSEYAKLFHEDENPRKRLRVVCAEGEQAERFEQKIHEQLSFIERAQVKHVL